MGGKENEGGCSGASCININKLVQEPKGEFLKAQSLIVACIQQLFACMQDCNCNNKNQGYKHHFLKKTTDLTASRDGFTLTVHFLPQNDSRHNSGGAVSST